MAGRRAVLAGVAMTALPPEAPATPTPALAPASARMPLGEFRRGDFSMVGVFDIDWLTEPRMTRMLDAMAASPGAFGAVRVFGALNAGEREATFPVSGGTTWPAPDAPMDFAPTLAALEALISRGLTPFLPLAFFPAAVSPAPIEPPVEFARWQVLVRGFLDAVVARFGAAEVARWWFEVWNEPNMPPFWRGDFERYLDLYRATAEAVRASGHRIRLGGPVIAWMPEEGPRLMRRFLEFLRDEPGMPCEFLSYHRKGIWVREEVEPRLSRLVEAAEATAAMAKELLPGRYPGLALVNDEADMKVGFDAPYAPRLDERFPSWLAASAIAHTALSLKHGLRILAAADNANQHLVRAPFDGRRALFTRTDAGPEDLVKLPVFGFYEMLRLLGERVLSIDPGPDLLQVTTLGEGRVAALVTLDAEGAGGPQALRWAVEELPWPRVNLAVFRIDDTHSNAFTAAGRLMPAAVDAVAARRLRRAAELAVEAPLRSGLVPHEGRLALDLALSPATTLLVWITPFDPTPPAMPAEFRAEPRGADVLLRWLPAHAPGFYGYEVLRRDGTGPWHGITPMPLRAAEWWDTAPPDGPLDYRLHAVSASGLRSPAAALALQR